MSSNFVDNIGGSGHPANLSTTAMPARRIGKQSYQAVTAIVESDHVTYQQKQHIFGFIGPTIGMTRRGTGGVFGGGGAINSTNESVVQVVYRDFNGRMKTEELPASVSALKGSILRLDFMNDNVYAVQNLSGGQDMRGLMGPNSFIARPSWSWVKTILAIIAALALVERSWEGVLLFGTYPAITAYRMFNASKERRELGEYMNLALSSGVA